MEITPKKYQIDNTKKYIKTNSLFFFFNGINLNSIDWLITEQALKNTNFKYLKVKNRTSNVAIEKSIYFNVSSVIAGILFFIKPDSALQVLSKRVLFNKFESLLFVLSAVKLNNKIYSVKLIKSISFLDYSNNKLLLFQFLILNLKFCFQKLKKSK